MGTKAVDILVAHSLIAKNKKSVAANRFPTVIKLPTGAECIVTYTAAMVDRDYEMYVSTVLDCGLAIRRIEAGQWKPKLGNYQYVSDFSKAIEAIKTKYAVTHRPVDTAIDTETLSLNPYNPLAWIISIQLTHEKGTADVLYFPTLEDQMAALAEGSPIREQIDWLLNTEMISMRGANLKYDLHWLWVKAKMRCSNFKFDTMLVGSLLDENRGNSLNLHTKWYYPVLGGYDDEFNQKYDKGRMDLVPKEDFLGYAGGDTDACLVVSTKMKAELLQDKQLASFYINLLHPAARAYEKVEQTGLLIDVPYYLELEHEVKTEIARLEKEAIKLIGGRIMAKYADNPRLSRDVILKEFMFGKMGLNLTPKMFTPKEKEPSTAIDHFLMFDKEPRAQAFVAILKEWASASKTLSTYICKRDEEGNICGGFLSHLREDGRMHPTYFLFNGGGDDGGTNTGRLSARDPAIQTVPKHTIWAKKLRRAYIAPPGMLILSNDYSQGELKIAACLANEPTMIEAYRNGIDLHAITASSIAGWALDDFMALQQSDPDEYDRIRQLGKAGNFGLIYGMGVEGFLAYAESNYGVILSYAEGEKARTIFFQTYSKLLDWHKKCKDFARKHSHVRSPLGRVRHLPLIHSFDREMAAKAERQSVNSPVQGTLSDFSLWATGTFNKNDWVDETPVVAMVHDQLLSYIPEENWEYYASRNKYVMENLPIKETFGWNPQLKFTVDCEVGPNLGALKKQKHITYEQSEGVEVIW
jgi:DNA polymerase I-like protein with 3'-5' exonuclease and polymerase domains